MRYSTVHPKPPRGDFDAATSREVDHAAQAGTVAAQAGRLRAPALDETVMALIDGAQPGEKRTRQIMEAFTRGFDTDTSAALVALTTGAPRFATRIGHIEAGHTVLVAPDDRGLFRCVPCEVDLPDADALSVYDSTVGCARCGMRDHVRDYCPRPA